MNKRVLGYPRSYAEPSPVHKALKKTTSEKLSNSVTEPRLKEVAMQMRQNVLMRVARAFRSGGGCNFAGSNA